MSQKNDELLESDKMSEEVGDYVIYSISELPEDYNLALDQTQSLFDLVTALERFDPVVQDAIAVAKTMDDESFLKFKKGLALERKGKFAGIAFSEQYGALLFPEILLRVSMVGMQFGVPWGVAYLRMRQVGLLRKNEKGIIIFDQSKSAQAKASA